MTLNMLSNRSPFDMGMFGMGGQPAPAAPAAGARGTGAAPSAAAATAGKFFFYSLPINPFIPSVPEKEK